MKYTREQIKTLHDLTDKVKQATEQTSELLRTAQDRYGHVKEKIERDGKEIEVTQKTLWDEVFYLGVGSQAGKFLQTKYPEVFEASKKQDAAAIELKKYCIAEFGIDYTAITLSDYMHMTEALFDLMLEERGLPTKSPLS